MRGILFDYDLNPTTWVYLSSLMTIAVYFKFRRFWSVRNLDLIALITFSPGFLLVSYGLKHQFDGQMHLGQSLERFGYLWLFCVGAFFLVRLLLDSVMVRRPLLKPNLSAGGLAFTGAALLVFLMTNVLTGKLADRDLAGAQRAVQIEATREAAAEGAEPQLSMAQRYGPGHPQFCRFAGLASEAMAIDAMNGDADAVPVDAVPVGAAAMEAEVVDRRATTGRVTVVLAHLMLVLGIVLIAYRHFGNIETGVAAASLYLLLPYTAQAIAQVHHVVPAALLVWAVLAYRRPVAAGVLLGLSSVIFYPLFLLPLWCSFYWHRGLFRFVGGVGAALTVLILSLVFSSPDAAAFWGQLRQMFGFEAFFTEGATLVGFWSFFSPAFRVPVMAAFAVVAVGLALWPAQKNLGTLLSCSAAMMLGSQFWHIHYQGGPCMAWYLPLLLLTVFRPNLEDRVAISALASVVIKRVSLRRRKAHTAEDNGAKAKKHRLGGPATRSLTGGQSAKISRWAT